METIADRAIERGGRERPADRPGDPRRWPRPVLRALSVALGLTLGQLLVWAGLLAANGPEAYVRGETDFMTILTGGRVIQEGKGALLYDLGTQWAAQNDVLSPYFLPSTERIQPYPRPPFEALLLAPLMSLPYAALYALWTLAAALAVGWSLWLLSGALPVARPVRWAMIALACAYHPLHRALWLGQSSPFLLLGLCGAYAALKRGRDRRAGASLALLALKPQLLPVLLLLLLLQRRWRSVAAFAAVVAGLSLAAMPVVGVAWPLRYAQLLVEVSGAGARMGIYPANWYNWRGLATNLVGGRAPVLVAPGWAVLSAATIGLLLRAWWRSRAALSREAASAATCEPRGDLLWALAGLAALLTSLYLFSHDLTLLIFPSWIVGAYATSGLWSGPVSRLWLWLLWVGYALPPLYALWPLAIYTVERPAAAVVPSVLLLALAAGVLAWQLASPAPVRDAPPA